MLCEAECRVLNAAYKILLADFDPREAIIFLEGRGVISEDNAEVINSKSTRLERLHHLLRFYRRQATDLSVLVDYFAYAGQDHIVEFLEHGVDVAVRSPTKLQRAISDPRFEKEARNRTLLMGGVPRASSSYGRGDLVRQVSESLTRLFSASESYFVVLHGRAGSGKTALASQVLHQSPELIGGYFDSVVWLRDGGMKPNSVINLYSDLLLMLRSEDDVLPKLDNVLSLQLQKMINNALIDRPNTLIVFDDVIQSETIRWAEQLGLRCLITTRNRDIMNIVSIACDVVDVPALDDIESQIFLRSLNFPSPSNSKEREILSTALCFASGNLAMLTILSKLSEQRYERLSQLLRRAETRGISTLTCMTPYNYSNIYDAFDSCAESLEFDDCNALASCVLAPPDKEISIEIWSSMIPVDVCDVDAIHEEVAEKLSRLLRRGVWTNKARDDDFKFKVDPIVHFYLREAIKRAARLQTELGMFEQRVNELANNNEECSLSLPKFIQNHSNFYNSLREMQ